MSIFTTSESMLFHQSSIYSPLNHICWKDFSCLISCASIIRRINDQLIVLQHVRFFYSLETRDLMEIWFVSTNSIVYYWFTATLVTTILKDRLWEKIFDWFTNTHHASFLTWLGFLLYFSNQSCTKIYAIFLYQAFVSTDLSMDFSPINIMFL